MSVDQLESVPRSGPDRIPAGPVKDPVFILGMTRGRGRFGLRSWHVAGYDEIREGSVDHAASQAGFLQRLQDAGMETRGVDAVKAGPQTKEEYCFIMDNKGFGNKLTAKGMPQFEEICQTVQSTHEQQRPLLLKNPWDFGNAHEIRKLIPSARFVYIHRHPQETINSMWRFLNAALQEPNPYMAMMSERYRKITRSRLQMGLLGGFVRRMPGTFIEGLILWFSGQCRRYLKSIDQVPESDRVEVTYDDLCAHPNETIARIRDHLGIADNGFDYSAMVSRRSGNCDERVAKKSARIERRTAAYLKRMDQLRMQ